MRRQEDRTVLPPDSSHVLAGSAASRWDGVVMNRYQENRIRHYHQILEEWMAR